MKAINKNIFREISHTKSRFLSLFTICAIGVGFFSGVRATGGDMKRTADDYYDEHRLFDLRVLSTFGLTDGDVEAINALSGVQAYPSKYTDLALYKDEAEYITRVYSMNSGEVNAIDLKEGRMPEADDECLISINKLREGIGIGDTIRLSDISGADEFPLERTEYKIVGTYDTPMYISITQRGSTNIGDGAIDAFLLVTESNFKQEVYTEIYVTSDELRAMQSYSTEYESLRDEISEGLEALGHDRSDIRYDEVVGEALDEIADGERELEQARTDGEKELADAKQKLSDAAAEIADGEKQLEEARTQLDEGAQGLSDGEDELAKAKQELDEGWASLSENEQKLKDARAQLDEAKRQADEGGQQLNEARAQLDESKQELDEGQQELDEKSAELAAGKTQLEQARVQYNEGKAQYEQAKAQYDEGKSQLEQSEGELAAAESNLEQAELLYGKDNPLMIQQRGELEAAKTLLAQKRTELEQASAMLEQTSAQLDEAEKQLAENEAKLAEGEAQITAAQAQLDEGRAQYESGYAQYEQALADYEKGRAEYLDGEKEYEDGLSQLNEGRKQLEEGQAQYDEGSATLAEKREEYNKGAADYEEGVKQLADAREQYAEGLADYNDGEETFRTEIADAEKKLADARREVEDAGEAKWYVFTRDDNVGYAEYESNSQRIDRIAAIFPVFFLLVAALVCLTTMSRMVEEQRTQTGTLKALGYSNGAVMRHYMSYAVSAAAAGSIVGAFIGCFIFPFVIIYAYSMMYNITKIHFLLSPWNILMSVGSMVAAISLTVFFSCKKSLAETPASLMRPKAPKAGKRVFLERIGFIWNNMGFFGKVSGRNLFRYKRRMFMTVVGIAGCTALSLTGFGLKDSISDVVALQYNNIYKYSGYLAVESDITESGLESIYADLTDYDPQTVHTRALIKQYSTSGAGGSAQCYVTAVEDADIFEGMVDLHERKTGEKLTLSDGAVITEKLAKLLGVSRGDEITVKISDSSTASVCVAGITEHYASHYLYLTQAQYEEAFGAAPEYNIIYFENNVSDDEAAQDAFCEKMLKNDEVLSVMMKYGASETFTDMMKILDLVIIVLIVSAGALAFVVLYNLTNVNITERIREIATLKVLGFFDREVASYVFRENIILSVMGGLVGLLLGRWLCGFVVTTAEIDEVMFGRSVHFLSYIWAFLITVAFSLLINLLMTRTLRRISMVESLKSVE